LTESGIFVPAIYRQGCFRNYLSCKLNKGNKLIYYKGVGYDRDEGEDYDLFLTTLVTNIEDDMKLTSYEWSNEKVGDKKTSNKTKTANSSLVDVEEVETMTIEQLKRYVDLLTVKTADNYEKWMKVGLILYKYNNSKKGFELFKTFSQLSEKYDEN
jgi:hypothetical protein